MDLKMLKNKLVRHFCLRTWRIWEALGVHVIPNHFYWPIQDTKKLIKHDFTRQFPLDGIDMNMPAMLERLSRLSRYSEEYSRIHRETGYSSNGDGAILYGMLRDIKPRRIIEVGSGYSTVIIDSAFERNAEEGAPRGHIISVEPYPKRVLRDLTARSGNVTLHEKCVEDIDEDVFSQLEENDVLFIDSSHVVDIANDVHYLYLRILPRIRPGVIVHIHDIRFPYEYPKEWVIKARKHWGEQYLLQMFLAFNDSYEILFASNYVYQNNRKLVSEALVGLEAAGEGWPGSFWIKRVK